MRNSVHSLTVLANFSGCNLTIKSLCCDVTDPSIYDSLHEQGGGGGIGCDATDFNHKAHLKNFPQWLQHHIAGRKTADAKGDDSYSLI